MQYTQGTDSGPPWWSLPSHSPLCAQRTVLSCNVPAKEGPLQWQKVAGPAVAVHCSCLGLRESSGGIKGQQRLHFSMRDAQPDLEGLQVLLQG